MIKFQYNDGGREAAGFKGKTGDCVCRAIAIATGRPYKEIYERLANGNATQRRSKRECKAKSGVRTASKGINTNRKWFADYMAELGFQWIPTMLVGQGCKVHLVENELPDGKLIVNVSKHFAAVIDGVLNDIYDCSRGGKRCIYGYYLLVENDK